MCTMSKEGVELKKMFIVFVTIFFVAVYLFAPVNVYADFDRFVEGASEFITAPLEIGKQTVHYVNNTDSKMLGIIAGTFEGGASTVHNLISGLFKMLSSPFASGYE